MDRDGLHNKYPIFDRKRIESCNFVTKTEGSRNFTGKNT